MKIIKKGNKDFLVSSIYKIGNCIDTSKFFKDLEEYNTSLCKQLGVDRLDRHHPSQSILNKFSGGYISPSMMKSYMTNPATCFWGQVTPKDSNDVTEIGNTVHKCFQLFYELPAEDRDEKELWHFLEEEMKKKNQETSRVLLEHYIQGFIDSPDYLDKNKKINHKDLTCFTEYFIKCNLSPFGVKIPLPVYCLADRIDFRNDKLYVGDYKTGKSFNPRISQFEGYLGSMIMYKWACEADLGIPVEKGFLFLPGCNEKNIELDFSLQNQSIYLEKVLEFCDKFQKESEKHIYEYPGDFGYFTSQSLKDFRAIMHSDGDFEIPIEYCVTPDENED